MSKLSVVSLTLLLAGAACGSPTAPSDADSLAAARARWNAQSGPTYSYEAGRAPDEGDRLQRHGDLCGDVDSGSPVDTALLGYVLTVPDLFDMIQDALDRKAAYLAVTYDPTYGDPTRIQVDYSANAVDDEVTLNVRNLTFFAVE